MNAGEIIQQAVGLNIKNQGSSHSSALLHQQQ